MKDWKEFFGVIGFWMLGMVTSVTANWSTTWILILALIATVFVGAYGWRAILEGRSGNTHYFWMALLAVVLTLISLVTSAVKIPGSERFLLYVLAAALTAVLAFLAWRKRPVKPSSSINS